MKFIRNLYCGEKACKKAGKIKRKLQTGAGMLNVYCIVIPQYGTDLLEIYPSYVLLQPVLHKEVMIAGLACGYDEAVKVVEQILEDTVREQGNYKVKEYLLDHQRNYILLNRPIKVKGTVETAEGEDEK